MGMFEKNSRKNIVAITMIIILMLLATAFVYNGRSFGNQATSAMYPGVRFCGEYKIGDGQWNTYIYGRHIPSDKGDVTVRGKFELYEPGTGKFICNPSEGTNIAFYLYHIGAAVSEDGGEAHILDTEIDVAGEDMCGVMCVGYPYRGGDEVTITFNNPHKFGNGRAIDQFFEVLSVYGGSDFENDLQSRGNPQRTLGFILILSAFMILGTAFFSLIIKLKGTGMIWFVGSSILFAGIYVIYSSYGVMYWSEIVKFNTRILGTAIMLYMFSVTALAIFVFEEKAKKLGGWILAFLGVFDGLIFLTSLISDVKFYDLMFLWAIVQALICPIIVGFLIRKFLDSAKDDELICAFAMLPMVAFLVDCVAIFFGWWQGGVVSGIVLFTIFLASIFMLLKFIPKNLNATMKARRLELEKNALKAQLAESRIAILISQIQPHFIYNTLGTIEQLCLTAPEAAARLVHDFSLYLRGNFSELDNSRPIRFSQEMNHVKHYTDIEQVRFPDMTIKYDLRSVEFLLPALSVQPLVENAIKHGLMGLEQGGVVTISAYETDTHYVAEVRDDGVGFDTDAGYDETKHVGIKNIRGRIEAMCGGTLTVESEPGKGTCATIKIPKEEAENESNRS